MSERQSPTQPPTQDRVTDRDLPADVEAEQGVLGSLLIDPGLIDALAELLDPADFTDPRHRVIWRRVLALHAAGTPLDYVTISGGLDAHVELVEAGGRGYLPYLAGSLPTALHAAAYAERVAQVSTLRQLHTAARQITILAYDERSPIEDVVAKADAALSRVTAGRAAAQGLRPIASLLGEYLDYLDTISGAGQTAVVGVPTGLPDLDKITGGLQQGDFIILAARPSQGKTACALSIARNAALDDGKTVAIFSLEMGASQIVQRLLAIEGGLDSSHLRSGYISQDEWGRIVQASSDLAGSQIYIDDSPGLVPAALRLRARALHAQQPIDLLIVDYLQLMDGGMQQSENRQQEISKISRAMKGLARELKIPILALSQVSRAVEHRTDKHPGLSDLRESGCVTGDTLVYLPHQGRDVPIAHMDRYIGETVLAVDSRTGCLEPRVVTDAFGTGIKAVYRLETGSGRVVRLTGNHKILCRVGMTDSSWVRLDACVTGDEIAVPRALPAPRLHPRAILGDVEWDSIASITPDGEEAVYDLTVEGLHNFVGNDVLLHNSLEQDADVVMFLYRDVVYNPDTDKEHIAELTIAKQRNGPTGRVDLFFNNEQTRFVSLAGEAVRRMAEGRAASDLPSADFAASADFADSAGWLGDEGLANGS